MDVKVFERGITNSKANDSCKKFFRSPLGKQLIAHPDLNICIRENYINIYCNGNNILKFKPNARINTFLIHRKYAGETKTSDYIKLDYSENDFYNITDLTYKKKWSLKKNLLENPSELKRLFSDRVGEKTATDKYLKKKNPYLLDLEIAFSREVTDSDRNKKHYKKDIIADRIDMLTINTTKIPKLIFTEIKLAKNPELRSETKPDILDQIDRYTDFIKNSRKQIRKSYRTVAENILDYNIFNNNNAFKKVLTLIVADKFDIEDCPNLLIISNATDKTVKEAMKGKKNKDGTYICHLEELEKEQKEKFSLELHTI